MALYQADWLLTLQGREIRDGLLAVQGKKIAFVGEQKDLPPVFRSQEIHRFSKSILMPGFINAHAHLELGWARGLVSPSQGFCAWVQRLMTAAQDQAPQQFEDSVRLGARECLKNGITSVVDIGNLPISRKALAEENIRSWAMHELIGLSLERATEQVLRVEGKLGGEKSSLHRESFTCHAPYSCHPLLWNAALRFAEQAQIPLSFHLAESEEEERLFSKREGPLWDFCFQRGLRLDASTPRSPLGYLLKNDWLPKGALVVHGNTLSELDARTLLEYQCSLVHCPRSHTFFNHPEFKVELFHEMGLNLCLGTDSLASNEGLDFIEEMALLKRQHPKLECETIVRMATCNGAMALGMQKQLGILAEGAYADFIALGLEHSSSCNLYEELVREGGPVNAVILEGQEVLI